jgi:hypothetical protein
MTDYLGEDAPKIAEIAEIFKKIEDIFLNIEHDYLRFRDLWDRNIKTPIYIAEEHKEIIADWASLDSYFENAAMMLGSVVCKYELKGVVPIQADLVTAYCQMEWQAAIKPAVEKMGGYVRVVAVLRKSDAGWRLVSYVEAPLAPIIYMGELYKLVAQISPLK